MITSYLKISFRTLVRNKAFSFINLAGLALALAIFLLISNYTYHEFSFNKFHKKHERIYQLHIGDDFFTTAPLGTAVRDAFPELENTVRLDPFYGGGLSPILQIQEGDSQNKFRVNDVLFADPSFFDVFDFDLINGSPQTALNDPYSIVLTKNTSRLLFGTENAVGKTIHYIGDRSGRPEMDVMVTGVVEDPPSNSSIRFSALASFSTLKIFREDIEQDWRNWGYQTYILVKDNNKNDIEDKLSQFWLAKQKELWPRNTPSELSAVALADAPFFNNNKRQLLFFIQTIGIFILVIAVINFINLTIAKSAVRTKEIGIRKAVGSRRMELMRQFLFESIFMCLLVTPIALFLVELFKFPLFKLIDKRIPVYLMQEPLVFIGIIGLVMLVGLVAGIYPAVYLSSFNAATIVKGQTAGGKDKTRLRFVLFVFQFVVCISLILCTLLINRQLDFLKTKPLGFSHKNIIHLTQSRQIGEKYDVFKNKLLQHTNIHGVTRANQSFGQDLNIGMEHEINGLRKEYLATTVDPDFIPTMGVEVVDGRPFSWEIPTDRQGALVVNETFVKEFELENPIGTEIKFFNWRPQIIGVVKDFHYTSFHTEVEPAALWYDNWNAHINIKIAGHNISESIKHIETVWQELSPGIPFEYEFLDKTYDELYKAEFTYQKLIGYFSIIAIIIACLGLFGLVSYNVEQRLKEIGIRKVLGASIASLLILLSKRYIKWVLVANLIAWPIAWHAMNNWLQNFAYRIEMSWWMFALAGGIALTIALLTVSWQAIRAAMANPVEALRYE